MTNAAEMQIVVELKDKASASLKNVNRSFSSTAAGITKGVAKMAAGFALLMGAAAIGGTIVVLKKSISAFIEFEDAMAGVAKTTGLSGEALKELGDDIRNLSKSVPVAAVELAEIAAIAGQLGIEGTDNIIAFTETVAQISVAFDMTAEKSAIAMAKLGNIYDLPIEQTSNLASAINTLGNSTAAFEREIITFMMSLGAGAKSLGFTSDEVAALGATLVGVGQDANDAGTRMNQAFTQMAKKVDVFAQYLGITDEEFRKAFGKAPMKMLISIVAKIKEIEDPLLQQAKAASLFGTIGAKAIKGLIGGFDDLSVNLENSATGFEENTSLAAEYAAKTSTLKAAIKLLKNNLHDVAITIGTKLAPFVTILVDKFVEFIPIIEEMAADIWRDLEPALKKLWDKFNDIYPTIKTVGSELIDRLKPAFDDLKSAFDSIIKIGSNLISGFSKNETAMGSLTAVINIAIDAFNWFAKAISTVLGFLAEHPKVATVVVGAILLMVAPILKIIAVMVILATAWDQNWFGIKDTTLRVVDIIVDYLKWSFQKIQDFWAKHGDTIMAVVDYMWTGIKTTIEIVISTISLIINVFLDILEGDWSGAWDRIKKYVGTALDKIEKLFNTWKDTFLPIFSNLWDTLETRISDWASDTSGYIETWANDTKGYIETWATDTSSEFDCWVTDTSLDISNWVIDTTTEIHDWVTNTSVEITFWSDDTSGEITLWSLNTSGEISSWASETSEKIGGWAVDTFGILFGWHLKTVVIIAEWASETYNKISIWASETWTKIEKWVLDVKQEFIDWKDSILQTVQDWYDKIIDYFDFSKIKVKWPEIPDPFAGVDWCASIPNWVKNALGVCGGKLPHLKAHIKHAKEGHTKYEKDAHTKSERPPTAPWTKHDKAGHEKWQRVFMADGGPVKEDLDARLHEGEYVVPKAGVLVKGGGSTPEHLQMTYHIGTVNGVDDLDKLLEKHDRELYRRLVSLV